MNERNVWTDEKYSFILATHYLDNLHRYSARWCMQIYAHIHIQTWHTCVLNEVPQYKTIFL
jgi:hypothetical protein